MGPALEKLNGKRKQFAINMASGTMSNTEAAKQAGYSKRTAYSQAGRLLKNDEVIAAIRELKDEIAERMILSKAQALGILCSIAIDDENHPNTKIKAVETMTKMVPGWKAVEKVENTIKGDPDAPLKISPEDAYRRLIDGGE